MNLEVVTDSLQEDVLSQVIAEHSDDGTAFEIGDLIEDLVDFEGVSNRYFNWVRSP
jgi:hypothetical protein